MLRAQSDEDLVGAGPNPAPWQHARAQLLDQIRIVTVNAVTCPAPYGLRGERFARAFTPFGERKQRQIKLPVKKRIRVSLPVRRFVDIALRGWMHAQALLPDWRERLAVIGLASFESCGVCTALQDVFTDVVTAALAGTQVAFVDQALVGEDDGVAGDTELLGELAA